MRDTEVVVPCYNEASRLDADAFRAFAAAHADVAFLFVNDGSTDRTGEALDALHAERPISFRVLHLDRNGGKAEAVRRGVIRALEFGPTFVGYWDADLATPLDMIPDFRGVLASRPHLEAVFGSRVRLLGRDVHRSPKRHYLGRVFATCASAVLGLSVYDTQCGAKLFRVTPTTGALFAEPFRTSWIFDVEILARLIQSRPTQTERLLFEFPLPRWRDVGGSKVKLRDFLRAPAELLGIRLAYRVGRRARVAAERPAPHAPRPHLNLRHGASLPVTETTERDQ